MNSYSDALNDSVNWIIDALKNCCTESRRTSKEYKYIVTFLLDGREKTLTQKGPSIEQVKTYFNNLMREFCPNEFSGWNSLEILSVKRRGL